MGIVAVAVLILVDVWYANVIFDTFAHIFFCLVFVLSMS